jgi:hypothetical protein
LATRLLNKPRPIADRPQAASLHYIVSKAAINSIPSHKF